MSDPVLTRPILLVGDNSMDVDLTCRVFHRIRVKNPIQVARGGEEALNYIQRWNNGDPQPVYILLDLKLPWVDGIDFLKRLKASRRYRQIPVIVLTASGEENEVFEANGLGADSYVVKPIVFEDFMQVAAQIDQYWNVLDPGKRPDFSRKISPT